MQYGQKHRTEEKTYYAVMTNWPKAREMSDKLGTYYATAYTDKRDPSSHGGFAAANRDVCDVPEALGRYESFRFSTAEAAFACAERLREVGVLSSPYEHNADWKIPDRGLPLTVAVVEHRSALVERIVEAL